MSIGTKTTMAGVAFVHDWPASRVILGSGSISRIPDEVGRLGARNVVLISDSSVRATGSDIAAMLGHRLAGWIDEVVMHVPVSSAEAACRVAEDNKADLLLCLGGGSATGLAKAVARSSGLPIVAVPTTYSGSEMTSIWGLTEGGRKVTGRDASVRPVTVIYDPQLTTTLRFDLSVTSGVNAIAHCAESLYSPEQSPMGILSSAEGIRSIARALEELVTDPQDLDARSLALRGAWLAGWSLNVSEMGLHHRICHVLGGAFDLPHSPLHSVMLPHVLAFTAPKTIPAMEVMNEALQPLMVQRSSPEDVGGVLWDACSRYGVPTSLVEIGLSAADLDQAVEAVTSSIMERPPTHPRPAVTDDLQRIIRSAWAGERPLPY